MSFMQIDPFEGLMIRRQRKHRLLRGVIRSPEIGEQDVLIRNLSPRGLGGKALRSPLNLGEEVEVVIRADIVVSATVRWINSNSFGLEFHGEIDAEAVTTWLQQEIAPQTEEAWEVRARHRVHRSTSGAPVRRL